MKKPGFGIISKADPEKQDEGFGVEVKNMGKEEETDSKKALRLLSERKKLMRKIRTLEDDKDAAEIARLTAKANKLHREAQDLQMTLEDRYVLAMGH